MTPPKEAAKAKQKEIPPAPIPGGNWVQNFVPFDYAKNTSAPFITTTGGTGVHYGSAIGGTATYTASNLVSS